MINTQKEKNNFGFYDKLSKIFFGFVILLMIISNFTFFDSWFYNFFIPCCLLLSNFLLLIKFRKNQKLFFFFLVIFYINYSIANGLFFQRLPCYSGLLNQGITQQTWNSSICILTFFFLFFYIFLKNSSTNVCPTLLPKKMRSNLLFIVCFVYIGVISILTFLRNSSIFQKLNEYSIIFLIVGYCSAKNKKEELQLFVVSLLSILANLYSFGRVVAIEILFVSIFFYFIEKFSWKQITILSIFGIIIFTLYGLVGDNYSFVSASSLLIAIKERQFTLDTAVFSFYCSATFVQVSNILSIQERLSFFASYIAYSLVGGEGMSLLGIDTMFYSVPDFTRSFIFHWGGGILPFYFYFWGGPLFVAISGILTAWIINRTILSNAKKSSEYQLIVGYYLLATVFRWYLYAPYIRGLTLLTIIILFAFLINPSLFKKVPNQKEILKNYLIYQKACLDKTTIIKEQ